MLYSKRHEQRCTIRGEPGGSELRYSKRGQPYYVWKRPVARISDQILDCVVYLYPSVEHAEAGEKWGGTGFLVGVPSEAHEDWSYIYCVTNKHVVQPMATPVMRLNTSDGNNDLFESTATGWVYHQDADDLAVCPIAFKNPDYYKYTMIHPSWFVTKEFIERQRIGPGDEVYMVGRFVNHQGQQQNTPVVRFGNISMAEPQFIKNEWDLLQESFLIETRSLSGFSGSPVFVYITPMTPYPATYGEREQGTWLLGVDWGHMRIFEKVLEEKDPPERGHKIVNKKWVVPSNSGQAQVVPAWKLQELLDQEELRMARQQGDEEIARRRAESPAVFDTQTANQSDDDSPTFTETDFEDAVDRVSRRESPPDQEN